MSNEFPVKDGFKAKTVTEPDYEADLFGEDLYVNLDSVRGKDFMDDIKFTLNIKPDTSVLNQTTNDYIKILFSGHRGSGKTTELKRLHNQINTPDCYYSVFIELQEETVISSFQPEDLYILIITKLIERLDKSGIAIDSAILNALADELAADPDVMEKASKLKSANEIAGKAGLSLGFLKFLSFGADFKASFASENDTSTKSRMVVKKNPLDIIRRFSQVLEETRLKINESNAGKDIIFIIDGSEKMGFDVYKSLCVDDAVLFKELGCNIIFSVPINAWFSIVNKPMNFTDNYTLPMIKIDARSDAINCLEQIVNKRIDHNSFFENDVLKYCVEQSGGCIRQLLTIVNRSIVIVRGNKINLVAAKKAVAELGQRMYEGLDREHLNLLNEGNYDPGEPKITEMLFGLALLKYNGTIKINPILAPVIEKRFKDAIPS